MFNPTPNVNDYQHFADISIDCNFKNFNKRVRGGPGGKIPKVIQGKEIHTLVIQFDRVL